MVQHRFLPTGKRLVLPVTKRVSYHGGEMKSALYAVGPRYYWQERGTDIDEDDKEIEVLDF